MAGIKVRPRASSRRRRTPGEQPSLDFMKLAVTEAMAGVRRNHGGPFGAVIVRNGKVVAAAHNEVIKTNDPTAHAEILAIRRASAKLKTFDLSGCEIYATCEPCPMCLAAVLWARIPRVYYGCPRRDAESIGFRDSLFYDVIGGMKTAGILKVSRLGRRECLKAFGEWMRKTDRTSY